MADYDKMFYGQHEDERILYVVESHPLVKVIKLGKFVVLGLLIFLGFVFVGWQLSSLGGMVMLLGFMLAALIGGGGVLMTVLGDHNNKAYITDRRVVRFQAETPWSTSVRTLSWDQAVKVKTYAPGMLWRMLNVGVVVVHAQSTVMITGEHPFKDSNYASDDDVSLNDVYYYRDLGNYIDKIIYTYRQKPKELEKFRPFVPKPMGKRG